MQLRAAMSHGLPNLAAFANDPHIAPHRDHPEMQRLFADLSAEVRAIHVETFDIATDSRFEVGHHDTISRINRPDRPDVFIGSNDENGMVSRRGCYGHEEFIDVPGSRRGW